MTNVTIDGVAHTLAVTGTVSFGFNQIHQAKLDGCALNSQLDANSQSITDISFLKSDGTHNLELLAAGGNGTFLKLNYLDASGTEHTGLALATGVNNPSVSVGPDLKGTAHIDLENNQVIGLEGLVTSPDVGGGTISQGSGAPASPNGVAPVAGDIYFRVDTPATAGQRIYICTTGGATPVWAGLV
jgi:hypothetical protein